MICRKHPTLADQKSTLFVGKVVDRRDTLTAHQLSAKHQACQLRETNKIKQVSGEMDKALAKVNQSEVYRYEKLFNTAYSVVKNNRPFSDYSFICDIQIKNGMQLGKNHLGRDACVVFLKVMSGVLSDKTKEHMKLVRFIFIMSDGSTDSSVTEQESVLIRYVHPETHEPVTTLASIENLENATADGVYAAIKSGVLKCGITLGNNEVEGQPKIVCVNMGGAAVNMGLKMVLPNR
ncbi:unnamed protein product [Mytilus coruscus]|uniref:Uncharacterized protein n=1 Tax=Mytilus coruscus TaxID=42192 RepID=A0A6J8D5B7_MYTCO|nr:unnamed protein product [Mytilus coruscus]